MPWTSSGMVSLRTRMTFSPRSAASAASSAVKYARPTAAPGEAARPLAITLRSPARELRVQHLVEVLGGDPHDRLRRAISLMWRSLVMSTAIFSAAAPVRLPTRVWSIQSLPCSMVNSVSHMSR